MNCNHLTSDPLHWGCIGYCDTLDLAGIFGTFDEVTVTVRSGDNVFRRVFRYDEPAFVIGGLFKEVYGVYTLTFEDADGNQIVFDTEFVSFDHVVVEVLPVATYSGICPCDEVIP